MKSLILSSSGLKNIVHNQNYEEEFTFFFEDRAFKMKSLFAEFISPYVSHIHQCYPTINCVRFPSDASRSFSFQHKLSDEAFVHFESISVGNSIEISRSQCFELQIISVLLQNDELFSKLESLFPGEQENDVEGQLRLLELLSSCGNSGIVEKSGLIGSIASKLSTIDTNKIIQLPKAVFYSIIKSSELIVESEDALLDLIIRFFDSPANQEQPKTTNINAIFAFV